MATKNEERWLANYEALRVHVLETGHFPNKHDKRLNWYKYNAKLIKQGKLSAEREQMIHELEEMRTHEHTGGRKKVDSSSNDLLLDLRYLSCFWEYPIIIVTKTIQNEEILQIIGIKFANVK